MVTTDLILKGLLNGTKILKEYSNPDILYSNVDNNSCNKKNKLTINYNKEKNNFYIYHSYDKFDDELKKTYSGRWYNTNLNFDNKSLDNKKKILTIKLKNTEWEDFDTGKISIKNVKIVVFFSPNGFEKINKYFTKILN